MSHIIPAVFSDGVFRPLAPVSLADGTQVQLQVHSPFAGAAPSGELTPEQLARQQKAIEELIAEIEALPPEGPDDGFSGRDHDKILYGAP
jgi:predicted DNA-binding antitoxin AbrB/MazE fold protein